MPRWNIDNLMTHVAAAALIVDDFEVDVNDLREDLKIENKEYVVFPPHSDLRELTPSQDQTVLSRARLQSRPTYTDGHDQVQVDKGRGQQPQYRKVAATAGIPKGEYSFQEEKMNAIQRYKRQSRHRYSTELRIAIDIHVFEFPMWSSGTICYEIDHQLHVYMPTTVYDTPPPNPKTSHPKPRSAMSDPRISLRYG